MESKDRTVDQILRALQVGIVGEVALDAAF